LKYKYLIIGSRATDDPKTHGGTTLLVKQLLEYFDEHDKDYIFIQAMKYSGKFSFIWNYFQVIFNTLIHIRKVDIVLVNVSNNGAYFLSPFVLFITKIFHKKFVFRRFAGNFLETYKKTNVMKKKLIDFVLKNADIIFFEPKYLVSHYEKVRPNVYWFPNIRKRTSYIRDINQPYTKKFVFLGQIREEKGIDEILEAFKLLSNEYSIDLYGNLFQEKYNETLFREYSNVSYKGLVHNEQVYEVLSKYDVLVLPSYMEGYPGVLIEAFAVGLPVISTDLESIKEMVDDNGILIKSKSSKQLLEAIQSYNVENYLKYSELSLKKFEEFEYEETYKRIVKICEEE